MKFDSLRTAVPSMNTVLCLIWYLGRPVFIYLVSIGRHATVLELISRESALTHRCVFPFDHISCGGDSEAYAPLWNEIPRHRRPSYRFEVDSASALRLTKSLPRYLESVAYQRKNLSDAKGEELLDTLFKSALDAAVVPVSFLAAARQLILTTLPPAALAALRTVSLTYMFPLAVYDTVVLRRIPLPSVFVFAEHSRAAPGAFPLSVLLSCVSLLWLKGWLCVGDGMVCFMDLFICMDRVV